MSDHPIIVSLGECLWDLFPDGARFGGAPANFACHAAQLGADARMVSCVGADSLGENAMDSLRSLGVNVDHVAKVLSAPTGVVNVTLDSAGKPSYTIAPDSAWDHITWSDSLASLAPRAQAVCFGSLGQRAHPSRSTIQRFVAATPASALRIFDINMRPPYVDRDIIERSLTLANILKLSDEELPKLAAMFAMAGSTNELLKQCLDRFTLNLIALTRGPAGALLFAPNQQSDFAGVKVDVKDTVGAGDSFTAAMVMGLLAGRPLDAINRHACRVAAYVCTQSGATPTLPHDLRDAS